MGSLVCSDIIRAIAITSRCRAVFLGIRSDSQWAGSRIGNDAIHGPFDDRLFAKICQRIF
ncbi:hypothetical protein CY34DRAFT_800768 [Suillus luteus UH-Slu-Lm8-n1]|uniref:Uncharacterized protein n=1 Tax=Suillus luteus UH-Slu-Lm8-n1 TaxID=930992 RepID=A0A0D0BST5_9AGAM|nr:hypothetical protein CY34DRAFT_800768 [Suillus luteus UH-Slu-Lm8-n1]